MVNAAWRPFADEIARWQDAGRRAEFWWRDDDAGRPVPALSRLFAIAAETTVPLALAVVPDAVERALMEGFPEEVTVLQHGVDHRNRAGSAEKKTEFSIGEPVEAALQRLAAGWERLEAVAGARAIPVLAPPWNRLSASLVPCLTGVGYCGLSTYGVRRAAHPAPGLKQVNTHVDVIDWKGGRGFAGEGPVLDQAIRHLRARRTGQADANEPTGWLTHHAVHDEGTWSFLARLFEMTSQAPAVRWLDAEALFSIRRKH